MPYDDDSDMVILATAITKLARAIERLGVNGAATPQGATEILAAKIGEAASMIASSMDKLSDTIGERS